MNGGADGAPGMECVRKAWPEEVDVMQEMEPTALMSAPGHA